MISNTFDELVTKKETTKKEVKTDAIETILAESNGDIGKLVDLLLEYTSTIEDDSNDSDAPKEDESSFIPPENDDDTEERSRPKLKELYDYLHSRGTWVSATEAADALDMDERSIRRLGNESKGHIFAGEDGYKITTEASKDEIKKADRIKKQAIELMDRYKEIIGVWKTKKDFKTEDFK